MIQIYRKIQGAFAGAPSQIFRVNLDTEDGFTAQIANPGGRSPRELYKTLDASIRLQRKGMNNFSADLVASVSKTWMQLHPSNVNRHIFMQNIFDEEE